MPNPPSASITPYNAALAAPRPGEAATDAAILRSMRGILDTTWNDCGHSVRSVHAKSHGLLEGELRVLDGLPPALAQGAFVTAVIYPVVLRISTNPGDILDDTVSTRRPRASSDQTESPSDEDARKNNSQGKIWASGRTDLALAIKLIGVEGRRLPGSEGDSTQDFIMVNGPAFVAPNSAAFASFNPWHGLAAHQPLGSINRARKSAYAMSAGYRAEHNGCPMHEPRAAVGLSGRPASVYGTTPGREGRRPRTPDARLGAWTQPLNAQARPIAAGAVGGLVAGALLSIAMIGMEAGQDGPGELVKLQRRTAARAGRPTRSATRRGSAGEQLTAHGGHLALAAIAGGSTARQNRHRCRRLWPEPDSAPRSTAWPMAGPARHYGSVRRSPTSNRPAPRSMPRCTWSSVLPPHWSPNAS